MQHQLASFFRKRVPEYTHQKYVLAVSGGVDSMVEKSVMMVIIILLCKMGSLGLLKGSLILSLII